MTNGRAGGQRRAGTDGVRREPEGNVTPLLRPLVWVAAIGWLVLRAAGNGIANFLLGYHRVTETVEAAGGRLLRAVGRAILWVGRPLARPIAATTRFFSQVKAWVTTHVLHPVGERATRLSAALMTRTTPAIRACDRAAAAVGRRLAPFGRAVARTVTGIRAAAMPFFRAAAGALRSAADAVRSRFGSTPRKPPL